MTAWAIVAMWVAGVAVKGIATSASLTEAEQWFWGDSTRERLTGLASEHGIDKAAAALRGEANASAYLQLLPYILDPHGPGSRLSVRRDPATHLARKRKREAGVFYTPADVAEYMASACLAEAAPGILPRIFDPACGTGVFLRAALEEMRRRHPEKGVLRLASECLFGADIDPWPLDAAAFVLFSDCWPCSEGNGTSPGKVWRQLRENLTCIDTLRIDAEGNVLGESGGAGIRTPLASLFPTLKGRPTVILGNPPYADLGLRRDLSELARTYETIAAKPQPGAEIFLAFVEQMIRLGDRESCSGALVVPLSLACNVGPQFTTARELIAKTRGRWRFAFFDREPHALFGEDVKTRNTIVLWSRTPSDTCPVVSTGPLRKWRGDSRAAMFHSLTFTTVEGDIRAGIPKIEGALQARAMQALGNRWERLEQVAQVIERVGLAGTPDADKRTVFVGPTAYNFLNVFLKPRRDHISGKETLSENALHAVRCASERDALAVFAILSSHLAYWWWHTHGDGFHVSRRFITDFPFGVEAFRKEVARSLSESGAALWSAIRTKPVISLNRGRTSLAYSPNGHDDIRRQADETLAVIAGLEKAFVDELQQFTARTVAAELRDQAMTDAEGDEEV
jgi:hypothetical protein